jgi:hypothetical protein
VDDAPSAVTRQTVRLTVKQTSDLSERHSASAISSVHDSDTEMHVDRRQSAASVHFKTGSLNMSHSSLQRLAKLREVRQAFFTSDSSSSLVDGDVPPKTNEAGLQQSASDERLHSDVSIRFEDFICGFKHSFNLQLEGIEMYRNATVLENKLMLGSFVLYRSVLTVENSALIGFLSGSHCSLHLCALDIDLFLLYCFCGFSVYSQSIQIQHA